MPIRSVRSVAAGTNVGTAEPAAKAGALVLASRLWRGRGGLFGKRKNSLRAQFRQLRCPDTLANTDVRTAIEVYLEQTEPESLPIASASDANELISLSGATGSRPSRPKRESSELSGGPAQWASVRWPAKPNCEKGLREGCETLRCLPGPSFSVGNLVDCLMCTVYVAQLWCNQIQIFIGRRLSSFSLARCKRTAAGRGRRQRHHSERHTIAS